MIEIDTVFQKCSSVYYIEVTRIQKSYVVALCNTYNSCNISDPMTTNVLRSSCMENLQKIYIQFDCVSGESH